jgi:hypothetical protein
MVYLLLMRYLAWDILGMNDSADTDSVLVVSSIADAHVL